MRMKSDWDRLTKAVYDKMKENRIALLAVAVLVVFVTTYLLVLPALTLDEEEAREQGGITLSETQEAGATESTKPDGGESAQAVDPEKSAEQKSDTATA